MSILRSNGPQVPDIPDDLTLSQFMLDAQHPIRQLRTGGYSQSPWFIDDETGKGYGLEEIRARVYGLANGIKIKWDIHEDDVVCILSPNHIDYALSIWAIHRMGAIVSCANPAYTEQELYFQLDSIKATLIIAHPNCLPVAIAAGHKAGLSPDRVLLFDAPVQTSSSSKPYQCSTINELTSFGLRAPVVIRERPLVPGENTRKLAFLSFSSGTTGKPKAIAIPHYSVIAHILQSAAFSRSNDPDVPENHLKFRPGDLATALLPFFHAYGLVVNMHASLFLGLGLVVFAKFSFTGLLSSIQKYKITHLFVVPPIMILIAKHPQTLDYDLSSVKYCMASAAPVSSELTEQFRAALPNCYLGQGYGMTETTAGVTMPPTYQHTGGTTGSAGQLISGIEAKVVKADGSLAHIGERGELYVRGPQTTYNRYINNPEANRETYVDGWVRTGDEVYFSESGDMFVVDRLKELIKCRGYQVAPAELEGHLLDHPDCADVAVVGIPDEYSGEVPLAFVALSEDARLRIRRDPTEADRIKVSLKKFVSDVKVRSKWLDGGVEFIKVIPKSPSGKLLRRVLRDRAKTLPKRKEVFTVSKL